MISILVVDDEPDILEMMKDFLSSKGYAVDTAPDGTIAIEKIRNERPKVVLLDIIMPGMWGIDVIKEIKKIDPVITVIIMTAIGDAETESRAMKLGAFDYITKPFNLDSLDTMLSKLVSCHK